MALQFRDYYQILGLERDASAEEIKRAFRKLARIYHPDVAQEGKKAEFEAKFKEINEAYEVLGDPEKRKKYDSLGADWQSGAEFTPPPSWSGTGYGPGGEAHYEYHFDGSTGFSDFFETIFGNRAAGDPFGVFERGGRPRGSQANRVRGADVESDLLVTLTEVMRGGERLVRLRRPQDGKEQTIRIRIPKGVHEGQLIRCGGLGEPGANGGSPGDLFFRVCLERHPVFQVRGADLYCELSVAPWECVLGSTVPLMTLQETVKVKIPPGSEAGGKLRLLGKGLPEESGSSGDLYVTLNVTLPRSLTEPERKLWEQLARESRFDPRQQEN